LAFDIQITDTDQAYLDGLPLSPQAQRSVQDFLQHELANIKDEWRADPSRRPYPGTSLFVLDFCLLDYWGDERWHQIQFVVDDSRAEMGVLAIVYVDHVDSKRLP
jgi:hypothetical protein